MAISWGGIDSGLNAGINLRNARDAASDKKKRDQTRASIFTGENPFGFSAPQPQPPMPGQPSVPDAPGGLQPMPPGVQGQPLPAFQQPQNLAQPPTMMGGHPQMMPMPGATPIPQAPPVPMVPPRPPMMAPSGSRVDVGGPFRAPNIPRDPTQPMSEVSTQDAPDPSLAGIHLVSQIAGDIQRRHPELQGAQLADAVDMVLGQVKTVDPATIAQARYYTQMAVANTHAATAERGQDVHAGAQRDVANIRAQAMRDVADSHVDGQKYQADMNYRRAVDQANILVAGRQGVADTNAAASNYRADQGVAGRDIAGQHQENVAGVNADASDERARQRYLGENDMARGRAGVVVKPPTVPGSTLSRRPRRNAATVTSPIQNPPPFPATTEGQTATSPTGQKWIVRAGKWAPM